MTYNTLPLSDYVRLSGKALGERVARGELSPVQLAECALHLAKTAEPAINAYVALIETYALAQAAEREAEAKQGRSRGPLHGVPVAIKDNLYLKGFPVRKGSRTSSTDAANYDSPAVARMLAAGTVVIGKTTMPEFGWKGTGISPLSGITRNPYDPSRNSGGSSSGSAATVAACAVPIALGSDAGGSVRIPAAFCGTVGLKPTLGRIPVYPGTVTETLSHIGPLCRHVEDAALVLDVTEGPNPRDPLSYGSYSTTEEARLHRLKTGKLRVGVLTQPFGIAPNTMVGVVFSAAVNLLGTLKFDRNSVTMPIELPRNVFETLWVAGRGYGFVEEVETKRDIMDAGLVRCHDLAKHYRLPDFFKAIDARRRFNAALFAMFETCDVLLMPTMPLTAFAADAEVPPGGEAEAPLPWITWTPYTFPFNISGQPAISVPCGFADGMPVGLQIVGPWGCDRLLLAFAAQCQQAIADARGPWPLPDVVGSLKL
jgi:aspartyl-tRNA(Asn)/glutamyl-tRNA(Gln) amidotransferase subunit A